MALVLKIAIVSAVLAAAFVYGSENGTADRPAASRATVGTAGPATPGAPGRGIRVMPFDREPT